VAFVNKNTFMNFSSGNKINYSLMEVM